MQRALELPDDAIRRASLAFPLLKRLRSFYSPFFLDPHNCEQNRHNCNQTRQHCNQIQHHHVASFPAVSLLLLLPFVLLSCAAAPSNQALLSVAQPQQQFEGGAAAQSYLPEGPHSLVEFWSIERVKETNEVHVINQDSIKFLCVNTDNPNLKILWTMNRRAFETCNWSDSQLNKTVFLLLHCPKFRETPFTLIISEISHWNDGPTFLPGRPVYFMGIQEHCKKFRLKMKVVVMPNQRKGLNSESEDNERKIRGSKIWLNDGKPVKPYEFAASNSQLIRLKGSVHKKNSAVSSISRSFTNYFTHQKTVMLILEILGIQFMAVFFNF